MHAMTKGLVHTCTLMLGPGVYPIVEPQTFEIILVTFEIAVEQIFLLSS